MPKKKKHYVEEISISNQQQGARQVRSNTNLFVSYVPTRPLALDRQTTTATESGTTASNNKARHPHTFLRRVLSGKKNTKQCDTGTNACHHWFLPWILSTYYACRSLTIGGYCIIQPSRPRGRSHSQCCCEAFPGAEIVITTTSSSFSHACACHVYIHVFMYVYLPKVNKQMHYYYDPYRSSTMGIFLQ